MHEHEKFCHEYFNEADQCNTVEELRRVAINRNFDIVIVGSDAVFRLNRKLDRSDTCFPNPFWLTWLDHMHLDTVFRATLAASSMGTFYFAYPPQIWFGINKAISKFDYLSVRDDWTKFMFSMLSIGRCSSTLCPDPIVILNDFFSLPKRCIREQKSQKGKYILISVYPGMLSNDWIVRFVKHAHRNNLYVYSLPNPEIEVDIPVDRKLELPMSPLDWFAWIKYAAGYIGVRFHAMLSAIINNTPFISLDTYRRRYHPPRLSKIYDLLHRGV